MEGPAGFLGSLTPDQEARLRQLWMFLLNAVESPDSAPSITARAASFDEPPLSPTSFDTAFSNSRRSISSHGNNTYSSNLTLHLPPTPTSPTSPSAAQPQSKKLRRRTSLLSNASESLVSRTASTHKRSMTFHAQSMGGIHLRPSPQNARVMQRVMASFKMSPDELRQGLLSSLKHDHPDAMLLRYLRARKWDVGKAFVMLVAAMAWRVKKMHVDDDIVPRGELYALRQSRSPNPTEQRIGQDFVKQLRMGKNIIHGVDGAGRPIVDIRVRLHRAEDQSDAVLERYIVHTIETVRLLLRPPLVETAILIFDMTDFSMANMDYTPIKFIIKCLENFYPESLAMILIHKAPWFFSGIWKIIKTWMNDSLVSKVHFTKTLEDLERFIPHENIPGDLGGPDSYQYYYIEPEATDKDENLSFDTYSPTREFLQSQRQRIAAELLDVTRLWLQTSAMRDRIGSAIQQDRRVELIEELRVNYWRLDPFIRARCQLDREGVIVGDGIGTVNIYPHLAPESDISSDQDSGIAEEDSATVSPIDMGFDFGLDKDTAGHDNDAREDFMREYTDSYLSDDDVMHDMKALQKEVEFCPEAREENKPRHNGEEREEGEEEEEEEEEEEDSTFDFSDDDEEVEIHDAVTHMVGYRGVGFIERAAVRVVNVS